MAELWLKAGFIQWSKISLSTNERITVEIKTVDGCFLCVFKRFLEKQTVMNRMPVVLGNAADVVGGGKIQGVAYPFPGRVVKFNEVCDVEKEVIDEEILDFRPREGSKYKKHKVGPYLNCDPNSKYYWISGRQLYKASTPVPPDGSTTVKVKSTKLLCIRGGRDKIGSISLKNGLPIDRDIACQDR